MAPKTSLGAALRCAVSREEGPGISVFRGGAEGHHLNQQGF